MKVKTVKTYDFSTGKFKSKNKVKINLKMNQNLIKFLSVSPYPITSRFNQKETFRNSGHSGLDFSMPNLTPLRSIQDGTIHKVVDYGNTNAGKTVMIKWNDGKVAIYGHLNKFADIKVGQQVKVGDLIGYSGNSGHVVGTNGGYHLHFGLKENGVYLDPSPYISHIQNMNNLPKLHALTNTTQNQMNQFQQTSSSFTDMLQNPSSMYESFFQSLKLHLINLSSLADYSIFIQYCQNLLQFLPT